MVGLKFTGNVVVLRHGSSCGSYLQVIVGLKFTGNVVVLRHRSSCGSYLQVMVELKFTGYVVVLRHRSSCGSYLQVIVELKFTGYVVVLRHRSSCGSYLQCENRIALTESKGVNSHHSGQTILRWSGKNRVILNTSVGDPPEDLLYSPVLSDCPFPGRTTDRTSASSRDSNKSNANVGGAISCETIPQGRKPEVVAPNRMMKERLLPAPAPRFRTPSGLVLAKERRRIRELLAESPYRLGRGKADSHTT
ncbi:hypothetical protein RRG08_062313 [Elysia crispata]|uniref:Uncharacterized protein n=1 Tax=Elysia crispata TaxID=231223 RepID=A0AAE1CY88_9GAST|nr:hypothetical protein RRG08_062313 [Elysia crispata]